MSLASAANEGPNDDKRPGAEHVARQGRRQSLSSGQQVVALSASNKSASSSLFAIDRPTTTATTTTTTTDDAIKRQVERDRQKKRNSKSALKENMKRQDEEHHEDREELKLEAAAEVLVEDRRKINSQSARRESGKTNMASKQQPEQSKQLAASLRTAANEGKVELVRLLLRCGADVNGQDEEVSRRFHICPVFPFSCLISSFLALSL